jgi:hypothetical protein
VYLPDTNIIDWLKISEKGNLSGGAESSVDVVSPEGDLLGKISAREPENNIFNVEFLPNRAIILSGAFGIWRVKTEEQGIVSYG